MKPPADILYVQFGGLNPGVIGSRPAQNVADEGVRVLGKMEPDSHNALSAPGQVMSDTYSFKEVSRLFDISEGRLRYWDRSGFLCPTGYNGRRRCYTFQDLVGLRSAKSLLENGVSLQRARRIVKSLQEKIPRSSSPLGRLRILGDSKKVIVADEDREFDADSGQLLFDFKVSTFEEEVVADLPRHRGNQQKMTAYEWYLEGCRLDEDEATLGQAEEAYYRAIYLDPTLANAYTNLGNLLFRSGSEQDAKALYQKAIEVDTQQPEAHYNLGFIEFEDGNLENAADCFSRAVELDATFADAHFNVAITLYRLGRLQRAQYHLQHYLKIEPTGPWADIARKRLLDLS